ncbi:MAG: glutathione peroxidase [Candidatus Thioglobus sp.]|jgi:glutathione peroxidase|nr:glutathione peroxidase [Candidatus Pseudothioglobus aerophilus]MBT3439915.1 glutathione peroxidase [Gammaproteobacteria bacterium]MDO7702303.1 glutathione peroxidase [SAR86 cluster bacterium]MBT4244646.1 glutathione peroxidase [Gammaproteobacteria bacterium]MBT4586352.1 glutathione peroxidase [Gammaproteobacteria bacterium]
MNENIYQFNFSQLDGEEISLSQFKGKAILIVNTASFCGLTYHYSGLEKLYQKYKERGLVIIGFPCNQFGKQEPGTSEEIKDFCNLNYDVTFLMSTKVDVNGKNAHPLFKYLKSELKGKLTDSVKWNFTKFLINRDGIPFKRFSSTTEPEDISASIDEIL